MALTEWSRGHCFGVEAGEAWASSQVRGSLDDALPAISQKGADPGHTVGASRLHRLRMSPSSPRRVQQTAGQEHGQF